MDGACALTPKPKAGSGGKAVLPVLPAGIDDAGAGAATSSARVARKPTTLPAAAAGGAADAPAAATADPCGGGEEVDDEQVERFYALLDNIRAMRGGYVPSGSGAKRLRGSEAPPPWRPVFRLEDFEEPAPTPSSSLAVVAPPCAKRTRGQEVADGEGSGGGARPAAVAAVARVRLDGGGRKSV